MSAPQRRVIVPDARLVCGLFLDGPLTATAKALFDADARWAAPTAWRFSFQRLVAAAVRRGGATPEAALSAWKRGQALMERGEFAVDGGLVLRLAMESGCPPHECEFVGAARLAAAPLVTTNPRVLASFPGTAVAPAAVLGP